MTIKKVKLEDIKTSRGRTEKEIVNNISDKDISEAVLLDEDAVIPTEKELEEFKPIRNKDNLNEKEN